MSARDLLDDLAAAATGHRWVDPEQALARARVRRRAIVRRRVIAGLAAAAAVVLAVALLPWGPSLLAQPAAPRLGPTGVPARYYTPPVWTPDVLREPIRAASLVLQTPLADGRGRVSLGVVVVSADGKEYRRLPGDGADRAIDARLSDDGRWVAWWTGDADPSQARAPLVIHILRLEDGLRRDVALPGGSMVNYAVWSPDARTLYVGGTVPSSGGGGRSLGWTVDVARGVAFLSEGYVVAVAPDGRAYGPPLTPPVPGVEPLWFHQDASAGPQVVVASGDVAISPDGSRWATTDAHMSPSTADPAGVGIVARDRPASFWPLEARPCCVMSVVGWGPRGVLLAEVPAGDVRPGDRSRLIWLDPDTGRLTTASTGAAADGTGQPAVPIALAADLVRSGRTVPGAAPSWPWWQRERLRHAASTHLALTGGAVSVAAIGMILALLVRWQRRRAP